MTWLIWALLSAFFAGVTAILAKVGVENVNSNLATAIRTVVILIFAWGVALVTNNNPSRLSNARPGSSSSSLESQPESPGSATFAPCN